MTEEQLRRVTDWDHKQEMVLSNIESLRLSSDSSLSEVVKINLKLTEMTARSEERNRATDRQLAELTARLDRAQSWLATLSIGILLYFFQQGFQILQHAMSGK